MSKFKKKAQERRAETAQKTNNGDENLGKITTIRKKRLTSYKVSPLTMRMSITDKANIIAWTNEIDDLCRHNASPAKLFRALYQLKDQIDSTEIAKLIDEMP